MSDYIKKEDAIEAITDCIRARLYWRTNSNDERQGLNVAMCAIEDVPIADVVEKELYQKALSDVVRLSVERKRGKWKRKWDHRNGFDYAYEVCSECGAPVNVCGYNYCPECGAYMKSEDEG